MTTFERARQISRKLHNKGFDVEGKDNRVMVSLDRKVHTSEIVIALDFETDNLALASRRNSVMITVTK